MAASTSRVEHLPSAHEMRECDSAAIAAGISSETLMNRAGAAVAEEIIARYPECRRIVVLCGPGNNGGDGLVAARLLRSAERRVATIIPKAIRYSEGFVREFSALNASVGTGRFFEIDAGERFDREQTKRDVAALDLVETTSLWAQVCAEDGAPFPSPENCPALSLQEFLAILTSSDLVVDAILGTGQRNAPRGVLHTLVSAVAAVRDSTRSTHGRCPAVLAIDLPTGVDGDTGGCFSPHVEADCTVAIEFVKRGCVQYPARGACGLLVVRPIGIASVAAQATQAIEFSRVEQSVGALSLPEHDGHKGLRGKVLVVAGSRDMPGAAVLSSESALRSGAGTVTRIVSSSWPRTQTAPEIMNRSVCGSESHFCVADVPAITSTLEGSDCVILGPGLWGNEGGGTPDTSLCSFVGQVLDRSCAAHIPCVVDASALQVLAAQPRTFYDASVVLTPHPGEAAALLGCATAKVQGDRYQAARDIALKFGCAVVLKGASSIVYAAETGANKDGVQHGRGQVVVRGSPYMATAGSGDVLAGVIAALVGQLNVHHRRSGNSVGPCDLLRVVSLAVHVHAVAGERAAEEQRGPIIASDIIRAIPGVIGEIAGFLNVENAAFICGGSKRGHL